MGPLKNQPIIFLLLTLSFTSAAPGAGPCNGDGSLVPQCDGRRLYFPHEFDCSNFLECGPNRKPCLFQCPPISEDLGGGTLLFNSKAQACDWPVYVNCPEPQITTELINNSTTTDATTSTATHTTTTDAITTNTAAQTTRNATTIHTTTTITTGATTNTVANTTTNAVISTTTANPVTKTTAIDDATSTTTTNDATTINTAEHTTTKSEAMNSTTIETVMDTDIVAHQK